MRTIEAVGEAKLHDDERERVRAAADTLFFAEDLSVDADAREAVSDMTALARHLVESDRWLDETARTLLQDVLACGPLAPVA